MGKLSCRCLNVHISIKTSDLSSAQAPKPDPALTDNFFSGNIIEVQLSLEGVKFVHPCLVKQRRVGQWLLHTCVCCKNVTHATHTLAGSSKVLINTNILSDGTVAEVLMNSPDFCPLYKIIVPSSNDNQLVRSLGVQSEKFESLQKVLGDIQQQLNSFLVQEESAMEDRIKNYMEAQRMAYADMQSKVRRHKNTLVNLILASEQSELSESVSDAMTDSPTSPISPDRQLSIEDLTGSEAEAAPLSPNAKLQSAFPAIQDDEPANKTKKIPSLSERLALGSQLTQAVQHQQVSSTVDADGDLNFDSAFQDDNNQPFYTSDDETEDTDDSESDWRGGRSKDNRNMYSTSVPISVPMWGRPIRKSFAEDVPEEDNLPQDAAAMAASIKALAQSVHVDGTEMFGDLPRPRRNMSDFTNL